MKKYGVTGMKVKKSDPYWHQSLWDIVHVICKVCRKEKPILEYPFLLSGKSSSICDECWKWIRKEEKGLAG